MTVAFNTWLPPKSPAGTATTGAQKDCLNAIETCLKNDSFPLLVTGFRGVGCVESVRQALEDEAHRDLHENTSGGDFDRIHLTIPLRIPRSISREALLKRLLRKIYLSLVEKCVADVQELRPLVMRARQAYIRSAGGNIEIKDDTSQKTQQNAKASLATNPLNWAAELGAVKEQSFAHSLLEKFASITAEELEDELEIFSLGLSSQKWHINQGAASATWERARLDATQRLRACFLMFNNKEVSIVLTIVLYEMDQLEPHAESPIETVSCFPSLLRELRSLFGFDSKHLRLIAVGGAHMALDLLKAQLSPNSLLPRLFGGHVHLPLAQCQAPDASASWIESTAKDAALACANKALKRCDPAPPPIIADAIWLHAYYDSLNKSFGSTCILSPTNPEYAIFLDPLVLNWPRKRST